MLPDYEKGRRVRAAAFPQSDHAGSGLTPSIEPDSVAVARIRGQLVIIVETFDGHRFNTRDYRSTKAAQRAAERAQARGNAVTVVLGRVVPILTSCDPLQLVLDEDQAHGATA